VAEVRLPVEPVERAQGRGDEKDEDDLDGDLSHQNGEDSDRLLAHAPPEPRQDYSSTASASRSCLRM